MRISVPTKMGFGTVPLGNMYRNIPGQEALDTVEAAWQQGIRYFDAAPLYGAGLAEIRLGEALGRHPRDEFVLSTKVGRLILDEVEDTATRDLGEKGGLFEYGPPNKIVYEGFPWRGLAGGVPSRDDRGCRYADPVTRRRRYQGMGAGREPGRTVRDGVESGGSGRTPDRRSLHIARSRRCPAPVNASRPSRVADNLALAKVEIPAAFWQALRQRGLVSPDAPIPAIVTTDHAGLPASK